MTEPSDVSDRVPSQAPNQRLTITAGSSTLSVLWCECPLHISFPAKDEAAATRPRTYLVSCHRFSLRGIDMTDKRVASPITSPITVICLVALFAAAGLVSAQPSDEQPSGNLDGAQVASGWGPARPTVRTSHRISVPSGVTYDSLFLRELDKAETGRLLNLQSVPSGLDTERDARPMSYLRYLKPRTLEGYRTLAWALPPHPFLAQLMVDVRFYVTGPSQGAYPVLCAVRNGRIYGMPRQFCYLLKDCGWDFTAQDVPDWARVLALIDVIDRTTLVRWESGVAHARRPSVPSVSFQSVAVESAGFEAGNVIVRMTVDGTPTETQFPIWIPGWEPGKNMYKSGRRYYPSRSDIDLLSDFCTDGFPVISIAGGIRDTSRISGLPGRFWYDV